MPKKKPIAKRLKNLFEDITPEQSSADPKPAPRKRVTTEKASKPVDTTPVATPRHAAKTAGSVAVSETAVLSLAVQDGQNSWATLQVMDDTTHRSWSPDEQLLVKQVADQLSLALENARLFKETQSRAEELAVLNEMGNELSTELNPKSIASVVYRYTSRLMDTKNFYIALYDETNTEKTYPVAYEAGQPISLSPTKVTGRGFTDHIIKSKKAVFAPQDVLGHMKKLGIDFIPLSDDDTPSLSWLGVPMLIGDRVLGVVAVQSVDEPNLYDEHDRDILTTIASQAAIAVENARLFEEAQRRAQETTALAEVGREISATLDLAQVLERIAVFAKDLLRSETCAVYLPDKRGEEWRAIAVTGSDVEEIRNDPVTSGRGILGSIIIAKTGKIVNDASNQPNSVTIAGTVEKNYEHLMGVPIMVNDDITGLRAVWRTGEGLDFSEVELKFLTSLSQQAAVAVENARLYQQEQYRREIADTLSELARIASSSLNLSDVVHQLIEKLPRLVSFRTASMQLIEPGGQRRQLGGLSIDEDRMQTLEFPTDYLLRPVKEDRLISEIVNTRSVLIISDVLKDPRWEVLAETMDVRSWLGAPLIVGSDVIGILILDDKIPNAYGTETAELVSAFTPQAAIAIQNARLFEEITSSQAQLSEALRIARIGYFEIDLSTDSITITD